MGLRDILMKNGPRGRPRRCGSDAIMIAILGLLAYNVFKGSGGQAAPLLWATPQPDRRQWAGVSEIGQQISMSLKPGGSVHR